MPRNTVDVCIICGEVACRCNKVPKKATPKVARPTPPVKAVPTRVVPSMMGVRKVGPDALSKRPAPDERARPNLPNVRSASQIENDELSRAVTCLAEQDMLHRDELEKHRDIIKLPAHRIDAMIWKQDNSAANGRNELRS